MGLEEVLKISKVLLPITRCENCIFNYSCEKLIDNYSKTICEVLEKEMEENKID